VVTGSVSGCSSHVLLSGLAQAQAHIGLRGEPLFGARFQTIFSGPFSIALFGKAATQRRFEVVLSSGSIDESMPALGRA
jgi:hypothetical protein